MNKQVKDTMDLGWVECNHGSIRIESNPFLEIYFIYMGANKKQIFFIETETNIL